MAHTKPRYRSSDRIGSHTESLRAGLAPMGPLAERGVAFKWRAAKHAALQAHGMDIFTADSCLCACGKPALRTWKNVGYCKAHAPKKVG